MNIPTRIMKNISIGTDADSHWIYCGNGLFSALENIGNDTHIIVAMITTA